MVSLSSTAVKICGITKIKQALEIASLGVYAIGVVGVRNSKRYLPSKERRKIFRALEENFPRVARVWVIADPNDIELSEGLNGEGRPSIIQLHGNESIDFCKYIRAKYPLIKFWKALRISKSEDLILAKQYQDSIDAILLDSWRMKELGGTGIRLPIEWLSECNQLKTPFWVAGGVSADWIPELLSKVKPFGVDASSKVEKSPGIKDLEKVKYLIKEVKNSI